MDCHAIVEVPTPCYSHWAASAFSRCSRGTAGRKWEQSNEVHQRPCDNDADGENFERNPSALSPEGWVDAGVPAASVTK